jgi:hypothetical protein
MLNKIDELCAERDKLKKDQPAPTRIDQSAPQHEAWLARARRYRPEERRLQNISVEKLDSEQTGRESPFLAFPMCRCWVGGSIMATFEKLCLITAFAGFFTLVGATLTLLAVG